MLTSLWSLVRKDSGWNTLSPALILGGGFILAGCWQKSSSCLWQGVSMRSEQHTCHIMLVCHSNSQNGGSLPCLRRRGPAYSSPLSKL